jgi:hypothetical protein
MDREDDKERTGSHLDWIAEVFGGKGRAWVDTSFGVCGNRLVYRGLNAVGSASFHQIPLCRLGAISRVRNKDLIVSFARDASARTSFTKCHPPNQ